MRKRKINWNKQAIQQFNQIISFIAADSIQNSLKVRDEMLSKIEELPTNPEIHSPDKYKQNNDGNFRAFELYSYRIAYYVSTKELRILRVRHTSREPKIY